MKKLRPFISYSAEDLPVALELLNLLRNALGPNCDPYLDRKGIAFGAEIKTDIVEALDRADVLIAVMAGAQPASALSWPAWEISRFSAGWDPVFRGAKIHETEANETIGKVVVITNGNIALGPEWGKRNVVLGITDQLLLDNKEKPGDVAAIRSKLMANSQVLEYMRKLESLVSSEQEYHEFIKNRDKTLDELVADFKWNAYQELKRRIRGISKPTKQLIVRFAPGVSEAESLPDDAKVFSIGGASEIFGKSEEDEQLFIKFSDSALGSERYEANWRKFKEAVLDNKYGAYWCGILEQAVVGAKKRGAKLDPNLVIVSVNEQRYRVIATTVTTYFNGDAEVSLYLIPGLQRHERGDEETTRLLNCLTLTCRFRFAFLEGTSTYYWRNFENASDPLWTRVKDLLMELDYLKTEASQANLEKPGVYEEFITSDQLTRMITIWKDVNSALRTACNAVLETSRDRGEEAKLSKEIVVQLKRIFDEVKPFNSLLGAALAKRLREIFESDIGERAETPTIPPTAPSP